MMSNYLKTHLLKNIIILFHFSDIVLSALEIITASQIWHPIPSFQSTEA